MKDWFWVLFAVGFMLVAAATSFHLGRTMGYEAGRHDAIVSKVDSIKDTIERVCP